MYQSKIITSGRGSASSMITTLAVSGWLIAILLFAGIVYHKARSAYLEAEIARYEQVEKINSGRTMEQRQRYTQYRRDL